jgi:nucleoid DNA-binding protein
MPARANNTAAKKATKAVKPSEPEIVDELVEEEVEDVVEEEVEEDVEEDADGDVEEDVEEDDTDNKENAEKRTCSAVPASIVKLVQASIADDIEISLKKLKFICDSLIGVIVNEVESGKSVTLTNHFTFKRAYRAERTHKVISTGESMTKPEHYTMTVQVKPALKNRLYELEIETDDRQAYMDKKNKVKKPKAAKETKETKKDEEPKKTATGKKTAAKK